MVQLAVIIFGLLVGSFLNVCIYRIPLGRTKGLASLDDDEEDITAPPPEPSAKITIVSPSRSFCPHCQAQLRWYHNIPLISWMALRGRCAFCKAKISARYPLVELLSAAIALGSFLQFGLSATALLVYCFCAALIVISFIDYDYYIIPNVISIPGTVLGVVVGLANEFLHLFNSPVVPGLGDSLIGLFIGGGFLLLIAEFYIRVRKKVGLGVGDIKLLAMTGAFFGVKAAFFTIFIGSLLGSVFGIAIILLSKRGASHPIPFGPYLAAGTVLYIFYGMESLEVFRFGFGIAGSY